MSPKENFLGIVGGRFFYRPDAISCRPPSSVKTTIIRTKVY